MTDNAATPPAFMPNFIVDLPARTDQMAAHDRIAEAIARTVRARQVEIVGVLGDWGSGKSTVISLAQKRLEAAPDALVCFTFDAWQHQSDPQRRAFLETLVAAINAHESYPVTADLRAEWNVELEKLNRQRESTETRAETGVNPWTAGFAATLLLLPLGVRLIGDGTLSVADAQDPMATALFWAGWALVAAPFAVAGLFGLAARRSSEKIRSSALFALFANKGPETRTETRIKDPEPSAIEFQRVFRRIVGDAQKIGPPLVIIVDNLDRLPPEDALTVWSTVRSVFLGANGDRLQGNQSDLPTIVMPLDQNAIRQIYKAKDDSQAALAQSFIDKTFDVVFHVPKPVLSKRHAYLAERLKAVFGAHMTDAAAHAVGSVFERHLDGKAASPREINSFVNSVAVLAMQRTDTPISLPLIACYALNRGSITDDLRAWVVEQRDYLVQLGPDWQTGVAALHYGVPLDAAQELFIDGPLREAIQTRDLDGLRQLALLPGFERYFLHILELAQAGVDEVSAFGSAQLLSALGREGGWTGDAWNRLRALSQQALGSAPLGPDDLEGLSLLIASCTPDQVGLYLRSIAAALDTGEEIAIGTDRGVTFAAAAKLILGAAERAGLERFELPVPGGHAAFAQILLKDLTVDETRRLRSREDLEFDMPTWLVRRLAEPFNTLSTSAVVAALCRRGDAINWTSLIEAAREFLRGGDPLLTPSALETIVILSTESEDARAAILDWGEDTALSHAFSLLAAHDDIDGLPGPAALLMKLGGHIPTPPRGWDNIIAASFEVIEHLDAALDRQRVDVTLPWLRNRVDRWSEDAPLLRHLLMRRIRTGRITPAEVFDHPGIVNRLLGEDERNEMWWMLSTDDGLRRFISEAEWVDAVPALHALADTRGHRDQRDLRETILSGLDRVPTELWRYALDTGAEPYPILLRLPGKATAKSHIGPAALKALEQTLSFMIQSADFDYRSRWFGLAVELAPTDLTRLRRDIAAGMLDYGSDAERLRQVLEMGGPRLSQSIEFLRDATRTLPVILMPLATDEPGRRWMLENVEIVKAWLARSEPSQRQAFSGYLASYTGYPQADALRAALGLA